jgi:hypothetical protein
VLPPVALPAEPPVADAPLEPPAAEAPPEAAVPPFPLLPACPPEPAEAPPAPPELPRVLQPRTTTKINTVLSIRAMSRLHHERSVLATITNEPDRRLLVVQQADLMSGIRIIEGVTPADSETRDERSGHRVVTNRDDRADIEIVDGLSQHGP